MDYDYPRKVPRVISAEEAREQGVEAKQLNACADWHDHEAKRSHANLHAEVAKNLREIASQLECGVYLK